MLKVYLSDVSDDVKQGFVELGYIMLDRKRFQTDIKEIEVLKKQLCEFREDVVDKIEIKVHIPDNLTQEKVKLV